jgi:hypothetical protein
MGECFGSDVLRRRQAALTGQFRWPWPLGDTATPLEEKAGIYLIEGVPQHPEDVVTLMLVQMTDDGEVLGEIWLTPHQAKEMIIALSKDIEMNNAPGVRRWLGSIDGPALNYGYPSSPGSEPEQDPEGDKDQ